MRTLLRHQLRRLIRRSLSSPPTLTFNITPFHHTHPQFYSSISSISPSSSSSWPNSYNFLIGLFSEPTPQSIAKSRDDMLAKVAALKLELIHHMGDVESVHKVMQDLGLPLLTFYNDGSAFIELLEQLYHTPLLAFEVFKWRRKNAGFCLPITAEEYTKGIRVAGRAKDLDLAVELFTEASNNRKKTSSTYNALMAAYMMNGLADKCQLVLREFKEDKACCPTIVTYNIILSVFGRLMLVDNMEATLQEIYDSSLIPNVSTFNNLITGYLTAWMWDRMEKTYTMMEEMSIVPNCNTYMLMLRGFAHAGNLQKMEEMYALLKQHSDAVSMPIVRCMIAAHCKGSSANRREKIDALLNLMPEQEYKPWLIVMLIRMYAQEKQVDRMEKFINIALERQTVVLTRDVMRCIITAYFNSDAVDKLSAFVKHAECAGWRICRSLYHCKMVMYASQNRLEEMENVIGEMEKFNINSRSIKSLSILCQAYTKWGSKRKLEQVVGLLLKLGRDARFHTLPL